MWSFNAGCATRAVFFRFGWRKLRFATSSDALPACLVPVRRVAREHRQASPTFQPAIAGAVSVCSAAFQMRDNGRLVSVRPSELVFRDVDGDLPAGPVPGKRCARLSKCVCREKNIGLVRGTGSYLPPVVYHAQSCSPLPSQSWTPVGRRVLEPSFNINVYKTNKSNYSFPSPSSFSSAYPFQRNAPSSLRIEYGLCATSHRCPSRSAKYP